jgi:hypothetical protein
MSWSIDNSRTGTGGDGDHPASIRFANPDTLKSSCAHASALDRGTSTRVKMNAERLTALLHRTISRTSDARALRPSLLLLCLTLVITRPSLAQQPSDSAHADQPMGDAWWTGPMLAASPNTLPHGHILIEPYFFDVKTEHSDFFGSLTYALYGLLDRLTVGSIINAGYNRPDEGSNSSGVGFGDLTLQASYRLTQFKKGGWIPTTAVVFQERLPTGKFDNLGTRPSDGIGSGAYTTAIALYGQSYFWLPNHRILRARVNLTQSFSHSVDLENVSVYGTANGFRGTARPGASFSALGALEYSISRSWVLALDVQFNHAGNTRVSGFDSTDPATNPEPPGILFNSGSRHSFAFAPAIEYSWTPNIGVLLGTRIIPSNPKTTHSITPAIAVNIVR